MTVFILLEYTARAYAIIKKTASDLEIAPHRIVCLFDKGKVPAKLNKLALLTAAKDKLSSYIGVRISGNKNKKAELVDFAMNVKLIGCGVDVTRMLTDNYSAKLKQYRRYSECGSIYYTSSPEDGGFREDMESVQKNLVLRSFTGFPAPPAMALDIETNGLHPWEKGARIISVGISNGEGSVAQVGSFDEFKEIAPTLKDVKFVGHNLKFDLMWLKYFGVDLTRNELYDTMVAEHLINENHPKGLEDLIFRYTRIHNYWANIDYDRFEDPKYIGKILAYNGQDAAATWQVYVAQCQNIVGKSAMMAYEMHKLVALLNVQLEGMYVDRALLKQKIEESDNVIKTAKSRIDTEVPGLNPNSGKQIGRYLFEQRGLDPVRTEKGQYRTDSETLARLQQTEKIPVLDAIVELRTYNKLRNTYYANIAKGLDSKELVHGNFNQTTVVTGRLSSSGGINFQNIPSRNASAVECLFKSRYAGGRIYKLDYSQMELRLLADLSGDKAMLKAFREGNDFHDATAKALGIDRTKAKTTNFRIVYGGGGRDEAAEWFRAYPGAKEWIDGVVRNWHATGISRSPVGRVRHIQRNIADDWKAGKHKERQAFNSIIQGLASDITLVALHLLQQVGYKTVNTIHDSILIDTESELDDMELRRICQESVADYLRLHFNYAMRCPLKVDIASGPDWGSAK